MDDIPAHTDAGKSLQAWAPHSTEAEQALLGAAILNSDVLAVVGDMLTHEDFAEPLHQHLWEVMNTAHAAGRRLDLKLLTSTIGPNASIPVGGMTAGKYLVRLATEATTVVNARDYAITIRDMADQRRLAHVGFELQPNYPVDPALVASQAIEQLDQIVSKRTSSGTPGLNMAEASVRAVDAIAAAYQRDGAISGFTWGLKDLDYKTLGLQRGELVVLAGRPGMGKTGLGLTTARMTAKAGNRVLIESLEMGDISLTQRMIADEMFDENPREPLSYYQMRSGRFREEDFEGIKDAAIRIGRLPIRIEQRTALTVSQIAAHARQEKRRKGLSLLVVDHLHLVRASDRYRGNRVNEVGEVTSGLKGLAKELDIAVLALCQLSRGVESRDDKRPNLGDLRDSGNIEQDADTVVMLFREAYYLERGEPEPGTKESLDWMSKMATAETKLLAIIAKQRNGPIGNVELFCKISANAIRNKADADRLPEQIGQQQTLKGI